jgi:hypothetical protein
MTAEHGLHTPLQKGTLKVLLQGLVVCFFDLMDDLGIPEHRGFQAGRHAQEVADGIIRLVADPEIDLIFGTEFPQFPVKEEVPHLNGPCIGCFKIEFSPVTGNQNKQRIQVRI